MRSLAIITTRTRPSTIAWDTLLPVLLFSLTGLLLTGLVCIAVPGWVAALSDAWAGI